MASKRRPVFENIGQCGQCTGKVGKSEPRDPAGEQSIPTNRIREYRHEKMRTPVYSGPDLDASTAGIFLHEANEQ